MAFIRSAIIAVLISMVVWPDAILGGDIKKYVKIDGAFSSIEESGGTTKIVVYLFCGPDVQAIDNGVAKSVLPKEDLGVPSDMVISAAYLRDPNTIVYYGQGDGGVVFSKEPKKKTRPFKYAKGSAGGPDAVGRKDGSVYLFFGCQVVERLRSQKWGQKQQLPELGLPCDVDAAWAEGTKMVILKGDQVWEWKSNGMVLGPSMFATYYTLLNNWVLTPAAS